MATRGRPLVAKKLCAGWCGKVKPLSEYHIDNSAADGRQSYCKDCKPRASRVAYWLRRYGLTDSRAQACLARQGNRCPICGCSLEFEVQRGLESRLGICVDHDHDTGEVRGLLHKRCNVGPPANRSASEAWWRYCSDPPMRAVQGGVPLIAPITGLGVNQLDMFGELDGGWR